jgi:hypothetical protein
MSFAISKECSAFIFLDPFTLNELLILGLLDFQNEEILTLKNVKPLSQ